MIENVFRPSRLVGGKRVYRRLYYGRYRIDADGPVHNVPLGTPDRLVAQKLLRDLVVEKQREQQGIISPAGIRTAAALPLSVVLADYEADLVGRGLVASHVKESCARIRRIIRESQWLRLIDIRPDAFVKWRSQFIGSAKTKKEYQTSINAFLNWCVRMEKTYVNPLAKVDRVDTRGKEERLSRAFTMDELTRLCGSAPAYRRLVYLFLCYTGARVNEARLLRWSDLNLERKTVKLRAQNTKSGEERVIPLKQELVDELLTGGVGDSDFVFKPFPSDDALFGDMKRAGIERRAEDGRVLHFHAFRKTFQTWGAAAGVGQRSAQQMLGHSDPALTANVYTDVSVLPLHAEVAKLPWLAAKPCAQICSQDPDKPALFSRFRAILGELVSLAQSVTRESDAKNFASFPWLPDMDSNHD